MTSATTRRHLLSSLGIFAASAFVPSAQATSDQRNRVIDIVDIMQTRTLGSGQAAMRVTALGLGCMGMSHHRSETPDKSMLKRLIAHAYDLGVIFFDTAQVYGRVRAENEKLVGEAISPFKDRIQVATKFGFVFDENEKKIERQFNSRPENIRRVCEESLKNLGIETIDLFYQHRFDPAVPAEDVAGTIADLIKEGKVKHFGMCEVGPNTIRAAHRECPLTAIQSEYHLMWREPETKVFPVLQELGIGFVPYSPLNRGFLGGTVNEYTQFDKTNDNRPTLPRFTPQALHANYRIVEALNHFGRTHSMTSSQIALLWLLDKADWIVPIPGTTKISHLEENLRSLDFKVSRTEWDELEKQVAAINIVGDRYPAEQQNQINSN